MSTLFKKLARNVLRRFDLDIIRRGRLEQLEAESRVGRLMPLVLQLGGASLEEWLRVLPKSKSQLGQDLFVLAELGSKRGGYFVDFGATNGAELSNSYVLEKEFGWTGICAEPARRWHNDLRRNRTCHIDTRCVWRESNAALTFNEADLGEFSTIDSFSGTDGYEQIREKGRKYSVRTISLLDLLQEFNAPAEIDFLSVDTEGSELEILEAFDFDQYRFRVITCEHNYAPQREMIHALLKRHGYARKFESFSKIDDWYVHREIA